MDLANCAYCGQEVVLRPGSTSWYHMLIPTGRSRMSFAVDGKTVTGSRYCGSANSEWRNRKAQPNVISNADYDVDDEIAELDALEAAAGLRELPETVTVEPYRVRVSFSPSANNSPYPIVVAACDNHNVDSNWSGELPDFYKEDQMRSGNGPDVREMIIEIDPADVEALFDTKTLTGRVLR